MKVVKSWFIILSHESFEQYFLLVQLYAISYVVKVIIIQLQIKSNIKKY